MIPALVAAEIRETILDYLRTTWALSNREVEAALFRFLEGAEDAATSIFKGPYLTLRLPFAPKPPDAPVPLDVHPPYDPYLHQLQAWQRLSSRDGAEPQATIVTTGTGSGKTECFLYPVLDHCHRALERGEGGIKAIILYPMNALAADQARRIATIVHGDPRLCGKLRVGMYVGEQGKHREMGVDNVIDDRERLQKEPPDILLTNYRMLDLLLLRPKDQSLWARNRAGTLRYLVLDELHTYDGAQGTDVACLIRRLSARLGGQESICPVGTSATVATEGTDSQSELLEFAGKIFDQPFEEDAIIGESRRSPDELFALFSAALPELYPASALDLEPEPQQDAESHVRALVRLWFPKAESLHTALPDSFRTALGQLVIRHPLARAIIRTAASRIVDSGALDAALCQQLPELAARGAAEREPLVTSMLTLLSWAQRQVLGQVMPLCHVQVQLWIREVRRLLRSVTEAPRFLWRDENPDTAAEPALPMYFCRECGHTGWITKRADMGTSSRVECDYSEIANAYRHRSEDVRYLHLDAHASDEPNSPLTAQYFNRGTHRLDTKPDPDAEQLKVFVHEALSSATPRKDLQRCPVCDGLGALSFLASRSASLASVAVGHLYTTPLNTDRKLLAFSDSVQDASHRAGFFSGRTYRFSIRSGMLAVLPEEGSLPLSEVAPAMFEYWAQHRSPGEKAEPEAAMVAAFLPHDLEFLPEYQDYVLALGDLAQRSKEAEERGEESLEEPPRPAEKLLVDLRQRIRWEATREFGVAARIGRTLERSGCASVALEPERFAIARDLVTQRLPERVGVANEVGADAWSCFLVGLLGRVRARGGIFDDLLDLYVESGGDGTTLGKQLRPLLSPFGPYTTRPLFLTNTDKGRFDNVRPRERGNWYSDWIGRCLGLSLPLHEARDIYEEVLPLLVKAGVLFTSESGKRRVWGLRPEALLVSRSHAWRICTVCGFEQAVVAGSASDPLDHPCPRYRCEGKLQQSAGKRESRAQSYYRRFYQRKALGRVWSKEHTGLLKREDRENLELEFKQRPRPDAANMLSCTPTLEMGIDIGDLSATMLCSVPPSTASYLQRVGRAGRTTGNALILTFASTQQHDLHFFEDPEAVMAGAIRPPGCYLDAPEVLKRQALAFCFDAWARDGRRVPGRVRELLQGSEQPNGFPLAFFQFVHERRQALEQGFFELFDRRVLRHESRERLRTFFKGDGPGVSELERRIAFEIDEAKKRREQLKAHHQRASARLKTLESDEVAAKKAENLDEELRELKSEKGYLRAELGALLDDDVWGWLCEASLLPNYAFPEAGVKLRAFVRSERQSDTEQSSKELSWVRAPSTAISELAPFNTFYGSGHKVVIDNIDLDRSGAKGDWQFCATCHHVEPVAELGDNPPEHCPACGEAGWGERGRRRMLVKMSQVRAFTRQRDAVVSDETEDRQREFYETHNFYDVRGESPRNVWVNQEEGFGFELLPSLKLRRINFGRQDNRADTRQLGGREVAEVAFVVCERCGQVHDPNQAQSRRGQPRPKHRGACPEKGKEGAGKSLREVHLFRELISEAIRLVVPVAAADPEQRLANLRAALRLGLREFYGGEPEFLGVDSYDEPAGDTENARRNYLLVQDMVPGGTGLLAELSEDRGAKLKQVLEKAHDAIVRCSCNARTPAVKACYRCLYAYREQRVLHLLDRAVAAELLEKMLGAFGDLKQIPTVGQLSLESLHESELELRFRAALVGLDKRDGIRVELLEHEQLRLTLGGRSWRYQPQVALGEDQVLHQCRPDFMLYPEGQEEGVRPVAGFADGVTYHVKPNEPRGRIHDDFKKRAGIVSSGRYVTWSFGWHDVNVFSAADDLGPWLEGNVMRGLEQLVNKLDIKVGNLATADPLRALLGYLVEPLIWPKLAACVTAAALHASGRQAPSAQIQEELGQLAGAEFPVMKLKESVPGDSLWARLPFGVDQEAVVFLSASKEGARNLFGDPSAARGVLRLSDSADHRKRREYQRSWRLFLRAYNLLQFLPNLQVVTDEQLLGGVPELHDSESASLAPLAPLAATQADSGSLSDGQRALLEEVIELGDAAFAAVRGALLAGYAGLAVPYEVLELGNEGAIELGWAVQKVGAYLDEQRHTAALLESRGWSLFKIEAGLDAEALIAALEAGQ